MKKLLTFALIVVGLVLVASNFSLAQDPGIRDSLLINRVNSQLPANSQHTTYIVGYHDERLAGWSIPIRYKNPQTDVFLDSAKLISRSGMTIDTLIDRGAGTFLTFGIGLTGGTIPAGTDTFAILYFRTGSTWDPAVHNPLDTYRLPNRQGLSYVDTAANDIKPYYDPPGNLDVKDDPKAQSARPTTFSLSQNYPNPFNAETVISFALPKTSYVKLEICNILGQKIKSLVNEKLLAGYKEVTWDGTDEKGNNVASGVYFYRLQTDKFIQAMKMVMLK